LQKTKILTTQFFFVTVLKTIKLTPGPQGPTESSSENDSHRFFKEL